MEICVRADINPTEDESRVRKALGNIFPSLVFTKKGISLFGCGGDKDMVAFKEKLAIQGIRATARAFLLKRISGTSLEFELNKQAAYAGRINFIDFEAPLGTIQVKIDGKSLEEQVEKMCPR